MPHYRLQKKSNNMDSPQADNQLFKEIGNIQGTLAALNTNVSDFKSEFRSMTNDQNKKIEDLRKEVSSEIKLLSDKVQSLEEFKANYDGAKTEANKSARWTGGITGATAGAIILALVEIIKLYASK